MASSLDDVVTCQFFKAAIADLIMMWLLAARKNQDMHEPMKYHMQQEQMKSPTLAFWLPSDICSANVSFLWVCSLTR